MMIMLYKVDTNKAKVKGHNVVKQYTVDEGTFTSRHNGILMIMKESSDNYLYKHILLKAMLKLLSMKIVLLI